MNIFWLKQELKVSQHNVFPSTRHSVCLTSSIVRIIFNGLQSVFKNLKRIKRAPHKIWAKTPLSCFRFLNCFQEERSLRWWGFFEKTDSKQVGKWKISKLGDDGEVLSVSSEWLHALTWAHYSMSVSIWERESSLEIELEILRKQIFCVCRAKMSTVLKFVLLHSSIIRRNERVYLIKGSTKIQQQKMSESIFKIPRTWLWFSFKGNVFVE